jgi:polar amino acid transport system substrate-binding protein
VNGARTSALHPLKPVARAGEQRRAAIIRQAMGVPKNRGPVAADVLARFVEEKKASGFLADALARRRIDGASVAPMAH